MGQSYAKLGWGGMARRGRDENRVIERALTTEVTEEH
jgi:hypothetical protein